MQTARAIAFRARQGISPETDALAVVIQELVPGDAAGVMFTANPINGKRGEIMITAAWGLGEAIVGGLVTPDTLTVDKASGKILWRKIGEKRLMTVRTETGTQQLRRIFPRASFPTVRHAGFADRRCTDPKTDDRVSHQAHPERPDDHSGRPRWNRHAPGRINAQVTLTACGGRFHIQLPGAVQPKKFSGRALAMLSP